MRTTERKKNERLKFDGHLIETSFSFGKNTVLGVSCVTLEKSLSLEGTEHSHLSSAGAGLE